MLTTPHTTRVLVANETGASLYLECGSREPLQLSREIDVRDQAPSMEREAQLLAQRLVDELEHERIQGCFQRLALVAPQALLDTIEGAMPGILRDKLSVVLAKDLRGLPIEQIHDRLNEANSH